MDYKKQKAVQLRQQLNGNRKSSSEIQKSDSRNHHSTAEAPAQGVAAFLGHGEENAISASLLAALTGCRSQRQLRRRVAAERARGALILSNTRTGYYLPDRGEKGRQEIRRYELTMKRHARSTFKAIRAARRALKQIDGQEEIKWEDTNGEQTWSNAIFR